MQPMPQSICAYVCAYVYLAPTQRLCKVSLPITYIYMRYLHPFPVSITFPSYLSLPFRYGFSLSSFPPSSIFLTILYYDHDLSHSYLRIDVDSTQLSTPF